MIKTIVFDLGGVYFELGTKRALPEIYNLVNVSKEKVDEFFNSYPKKEGWLYRRGKITGREFWEKAAEMLEFDKKLIPQLQEIWHSSYKIQKGMEELVRKLRKNYRVIVFSGNIRERIEYLDKKYGLYDKFDELVFSFDTGLSKREMKMYDILLERINCKPQECVCIDDSEGVLEIEKSLGMKTILFKDAEQLKEELRKLGVNIYA